MKRLKFVLIMIVLCVTLPSALLADGKFFIQNRYGFLVKVDPASGLVPKHPLKKGPTPEEVPDELTIEEYEEMYSKLGKKERKVLEEGYTLDGDRYVLAVDRSDKKAFEKVRWLFMLLNEDNEMLTGLEQHGTPMPHKFPRVFEPKTKANFDIHIGWGVKFENGNYPITLGFSVNLTNFVMPSLEIMLKTNFIIDGYPIEPYVGGVLYGGFLDGFPIGLSAIGGVDAFPRFYETGTDNKNFFVSGELRLGAVLYSSVYYDSGINSEGIWKKLSLLAEGGFYFSYGYIWYDK